MGGWWLGGGWWLVASDNKANPRGLELELGLGFAIQFGQNPISFSSTSLTG